MSAAKENPCRKFQANIFNKSKCQNCFKPRESHLLNDEDLTQPTTLPQGTINMNQCTDVVDGEGRTGQKFSLCILTPEKEHFIRAETKEIISGWLEMLTVYPRTNKQNQKKKRKVEPPTPQEPGPAKMAVTSSSSSIPSAEKVPTTKSTLWQEEMRAKDQPDGSSLSPAQSPSQGQPPVASTLREPGLEGRDEESTTSGDRVDCGRKVRVESGYFSLEKTKQDVKAEEQQLPPPLSPPSPGAPTNRYSDSSPPSCKPGHPLPPPGPQFPARTVCSSSFNSLDVASHPPAHVDSGSAGGRGAERLGRAYAFKASRQYATLADVPKAIRISHREAFQVERRRLERRTRARSPGREEVARLFGNERRRSQVIEKFEALDTEKAEHMETNLSTGPSASSDTRQGRSEKRAFPRKRDLPSEAPLPDASASPLSPHRRAKSLDRRSTESSLTPDLLNFKKGWLTKQYEDGQWKKHWFVLADQSLRFYRDSVAEEAADLDGEIDLSTCCDVTEYPVQRNYGFQIHTKEGAFTLSAMTSGIRRNWIQTIMKHVHPTSAPDVTSSLPQVKARSGSPSETRPLEKQDGELGEPDPEQRRSRARERRREGRSKTFDWAEFRPIQQALAQERAGGPRAEAEPGELERERARRREERRKRFGTPDVEGPSADDAALRMEVDRGLGPPTAAELRTQNVHVEIEQRWHQVETTPLREEKQVPIAPLHLSSEDGSDRLSTPELTSLLEKELEQSQKEASDLLEQNRLLQDQLRVALGREQSAREGYVLQTEVATSPSGTWQRLHRVNQDLHGELEAQCQRQELITRQIQALKRSYGEAKDAIRHHEAEIRSLQARLGNAAAELAIKEQALAKLQGELKLEKDKVREQLEERQQSEAALSAQLRTSERKLQSAEALLLGRTQELRDLERQQVLQRDRHKEVQQLQERIADLSQQLGASERAQRLMEEKLQRNYELLLGSCEREKQELLRSLAEAEDRARAFEGRLQEHEHRVEALQEEKLSAGSEGSEAVQRLEEQLEMKEASIQKLAEHVQSLRDERDLTQQRFQELLGRVSLSDGDVAALQEKLRGREADYQSLEHSFRRVAGQLQGARTRLQEKEEELRRLQDAHEKALEREGRGLQQALLGPSTLGSSLDEEDEKLQAEGEIERRLATESLEDAEDSLARVGLQCQTADMPLGLPCLGLEDVAPGEDLGDSSPSREESTVPLRSEVSSKPDQGAPGIKRQRIRFSTIQCQKYTHPDGCEKTGASSMSSDTSQERSPSEESMSSEATPSSLPMPSDPDAYLSIIHSLETKLYVTEEKLKGVTARLESQQGQSQEALFALHQQWANTEARLCEQLRASLLQVTALAAQLEQERQARVEAVESHVGELSDVQVKNSQALACLESCREQLRSLPGDAGAGPLAGLESLLMGAVQALHPQPASTGETGFFEEEKAPSQQLPHMLTLSEQEQLQLLSEQIALEAALIDQIADSLRNMTSDMSQVFLEIAQSGRWPLESESAVVCPGAPADAWAKKVLVDGEFWSQVESLSRHLETLGGEAANVSGSRQPCARPAPAPALADATWVRAELSLAACSMRESLHRRLRSIQETLQGTQAALQQHRCMLQEVLGAYRTPAFERVMQQVSEALQLPLGTRDGDQVSWARHPPVEASSHQDPAGSLACPLSSQSSGVLAAIQEELALQLKDKASLLGEISASLTSLPSVEVLGDCRKLLQASQHLLRRACLGGLGQYSLLVQDAILQAQVCYAACRIRLEYENEFRGYKESWLGQRDPYEGHEQALGALQGESEELLCKQKGEYLDVIAFTQRENMELQTKVAQLDQQQRRLELAHGEHGESLAAPPEQFKEEVVQVEGVLQATCGRVRGQPDTGARAEQDLGGRPVEQVQALEARFQLKVKELQTIHEEELRALQEHYSQTLRCLQETLCHYQGQPPSGSLASGEAESLAGLRERVRELEAQVDVLREELEHQDPAGGMASLQEERQRDLESLKATCERGFAAMEETHQKKIEDLQRQHQRELEKLREEKDRLLAEETAATISAIEAMKNAHREEMERELEKSQRSQISSVNADVEALRRQYLEELQSVQRELEVLSEQYSQKCLENAHLAQALEAERQALRQCQRENQELNAHNQELNNRLAAEISRLRTLLTGDAGGEAAGSPLTQGKDAYELEVLLRVKESEIQYLKQEISSLKDELQTALRDKKYASDKYKDIYTELSIVRAKADCDVSRLKEQLKAATEALGEKSPENPPVSGYDIMKSKSNPDFLKTDRSCVGRQLRGLRSKSLKEGLTVQDRLKLFESRDLERD
ncbi:myosin phosphatase Rho-interacting protein isoform X6 [Ovis aries]|uniref:myosin phosphatase Rho-interacting protein isoform X6 n=1 Tax=Ovis aries TaxID=9940 RepID=UPI0029526A19|nr:myosin phosphatase Rho-interacting protein isoform X6 [Ovis aries]